MPRTTGSRPIRPAQRLHDHESLRKVGLRHHMPATQSTGLGARAFVDDAPFADRPTGATISVPYPRGSAGYTYDRKANRYLRSVAGKAQIDAGDGKRVTARNVVVLFMRKSIDPHSEPGHARIVLDQIGSGPALRLPRGSLVEGHLAQGFGRRPHPRLRCCRDGDPRWSADEPSSRSFRPARRSRTARPPRRGPDRPHRAPV